MRATKFEFQQRFWIIGFIFWLGFSLSFVDQNNFAVALLHIIAPSTDHDSARGNLLLRLIFGCGALLVFAAAFIRTWATAYLRTEVVHDASQHSEGLVADGPFRFVRNPLYLANILLAAGVGVMASRIGWVFIVLAMWLFVYRLILREEDGLRDSQGASFQAYLKAVPRLWPALAPRVASGGRQPSWGQAFGAEMFVWLFGTAVLCFAITFSVKLAAIVFACSFAVYFLAVSIIRRKAAEKS